MSIHRDDFAGTWIDVVGDVLTRAIGRSVIAERVIGPRTYASIWTAVFPEPLMFHRMAIGPDGTIAVVGKGNDTGAAFLSMDGAPPIVLGSTHGNNPCAIWHNGAQFIVVWTEAVGVLTRFFCAAGEHRQEPIPAPWTGTSQGILDLRSDGTPIYMDAARTFNQPPWSFTKPNVRQDVVVGQWGISGHDETNRIVVGLLGLGAFTALRDTADDPRVSPLPSGRILVAAFTPKGASLAIIDPPYPPNEQPPTVEPPPDPPIDPPEEPVFTPIRLPDAAQAIVDALYQRHTDLAHGDDDQRRALAKLIAEQVRFTLGPAWGWKSAGGSRPPSKDTIAFRAGTVLHGFDLFNGATREPNDHPLSLDLAGQEFIEVQPVNHLGTVPPVDDDPPQPPPAGVTRAELDQAIAALQTKTRTELSAAVTGVTANVQTLIAGAVPPVVRAVVSEELALYEIDGKTSTSAWHQHSVKLGLKKKA